MGQGRDKAGEKQDLLKDCEKCFKKSLKIDQIPPHKLKNLINGVLNFRDYSVKIGKAPTYVNDIYSKGYIYNTGAVKYIGEFAEFYENLLYTEPPSRTFGEYAYDVLVNNNFSGLNKNALIDLIEFLSIEKSELEQKNISLNEKNINLRKKIIKLENQLLGDDEDIEDIQNET